MNPSLTRGDPGVPRVGWTATAGLFLLAAILAMVLSALAVGASWSTRLAAVLEPRLAGDATLAVWGRGLESADAASALAVEVLAAQPAVGATALEPDAADPWIGALIAGGSRAGDGPRLISVKGSEGAIRQSVDRLQRLGITVREDDHRASGGALERDPLIAVASAGAAAVVACAAMFLGAFFAARSPVRGHGGRIALMFRLGARSGYLGRVVAARVSVTAAAGILAGLAGGEGLAFLAGRSELAGDLPAAGPSLVDVACGVPAALLLWVIAILGARLGARRALRRLERVG